MIITGHLIIATGIVQTRMSIILCDDVKKAKYILDNATYCPSIKTIILVQSAGDEVGLLRFSGGCGGLNRTWKLRDRLGAEVFGS